MATVAVLRSGARGLQFVTCGVGLLLSLGERRAGMMLNILQATGQCPQEFLP